MKKHLKLLSIILLLAISSLYAQDNDGYKHYDSDDYTKRNHDDSWNSNKENNWDNYHKRDKGLRGNNKSMFNKKDFGLVLAINSFDAAKDMPDLNTWQSRYVALQWRRNNKLITGRQVDVALGTGLEIAWNNFMMQHEEQYFENGSVSGFELFDYPLEKSKLVVNNVSLPVILQFGFKESNFRFGIGAYGGVRINSYQKFKEFDDAKYKEKGEYNLRKFNYGFMAEAGRGDVRVFAKYDILPIFNDNNPINANVLSVGLRL
jgi:hypothetical protein